MGPSSPSPKGADPPVFGPYLLWPNGIMDQDGTWNEGRPQPRQLCVRWGPSSPGSPVPKRVQRPLPNYRPMSIVAKQLDGSRWHLALRWALARPHCTRWGSSCPSPKRGQSPHFYCGQTAACINMPLGMEIGLSPAQPPSQKGAEFPNFRSTSIVAEWLHSSRCQLVRR